MPEIPPSSGPIPLDYAPAPRRHWKWTGRIVLGLLVVATAVCAWRWGPYAWRQTKLLYWQRQCMNYSASADKVVYEEEPAAAAALLNGPDYSPYGLKRAPAPNGPVTPVQAAAFDPLCWRRLGTFTTMPTRMFTGPGVSGGAGGDVFLHERVSPAGHHRLVCVCYAPAANTFSASFIEGFDYAAFVSPPATWTTPFVPTQLSPPYDVISGLPRVPPLVRMYAGQPDPADPAHFTIRYQMWGQEDTLDGQLKDDDQVTLTPRDLPKMPIR